MSDTAPAAPQKPKSTGWVKIAVDYGPMLAFFLSYRLLRPAKDAADALGVGEMLAVTKSTGVFIAATLIALVVSKWKLGKIAPMLWLSTLLVVFFGGLTILLHDAVWVQIKPTAIYLLLGGTLLVGWWRGTALLKILMEDAFVGLSDRGWMVLSRNWGWYFLFMAALNEVLRALYNQANGHLDVWIAAKLWVFMPMSFLFTFAHMPYLMKQGLGAEASDESAQ
ncbi:intracellular septation protein A [Novosphingobium sp. FSY-8]|uniref:Inner membrane-spanning protein YciB n=1 Tax=Novosphingobium ovatum TaxID=1908523 RepID=A0ABW9XCX9_9SPHN|nr:septation protein IspZ [Novosphingobium ovatum]NBC36402.1 intracellular septation protein A [Novosphingobium ovatum]